MSDLDPQLLRDTDRQLVERYSARWAKFGNDPRTLGWDRKESQRTRFDVATSLYPFRGARILDVGCGLADFLDHLTWNGLAPLSYTGCDINPDLIGDCRRRHPESEFHVANLILDEVPGGPWDVVVLFGLVNFRFSKFSNQAFLAALLERAFRMVKSAVVIDMLTSRRDPAYPEEDFVFYHDPADVLDLALSLTPHVSMRHDYPPIPQREMMFLLRKDPGP